MKVETTKFTIDAKKLKSILLNKSNFSDWIKRNIEKNELNENEDYIIEKQKINVLENYKIDRLEYFFTIEASEKIISSHNRGVVVKKIKEQLRRGISLDKILNEENVKKIQLIKFGDEEYPEQLKTIKNPPKQLYVKGNIKNLNEHGIAVIGTRHCSNYGRKVCKIFTNNLVGYNLNIISGLAIGIDTCAHKACIEAKGKTIAVLPSGFNKIFPKENEDLLNKIIEKGGTIVTEYEPDFEKTSESCRQRNRIISGLAIATLVVEAGKKSGTNITVRHTNEQNKKTFCIPSSLLNSKGTGTNEMIKENKAKIVTTVEDIIKEFPELKLERKLEFDFCEVIDKQKRNKKTIKAKENLKIEEENLEIYNVLTKDGKEINEIAQILNKPISEIVYKLTLLELQGAIEELPGNKFKIK